PPQSLSANEPGDLLHELQVHQFELEVQNEELKHSQRALELSREKYFKLYDIAPVGYCSISSSGLVVEANLKACELFGLDRTYLKRQLFSSFIYKDDTHIYYQAVKNLSKTGDSQTCELRFIMKNGDIIWVLLDISSTQDEGGVIFYLVALSDITGRKEIENVLEKARIELAISKISEDEAFEYSESIINTVRESLIVLDNNLRVVSASRSFYDFFKVAQEDTLGRLIYDLGNKQWDIPELRRLLETILPEKTVFDNYEVSHDFTSIGRKVMLLNARQVLRKSGKERIILLAIEDITERKKLEKEKGEVAFLLSERIKELNCFYSISSIIELPGISLDKMLQKIADIIPTGYQYPVNTCARITIDGKEHKTDNYRETKQKQSTDIVISNTKYGSVEVFYLKERREIDINIFIKEEQDLLEAIAQRLARVIERKKAKDALIVSKHRQEMANTAGGVGIWNLDLVSNELTWDDQMFALYGITRDQFSNVYQSWVSVLHPEDIVQGDAETQMAIRGEKELDTEFRIIWPDGTIRHINARAQVQRDDSGKPLEMMGTNYDITDQKKKEEEILKLSYHDMLTGLYNRRFLEAEIKRLDTERQLPLSIIIGDLNNLKLTNDTFGHQEGDKLLIETTSLLKKVCRSDDILARWGGDEFVILLPKTSIAAAEEIAQRIKKECSELFIQKMPIGLAIGIASKSESRQNMEDIIFEAESNMYKNKLAGKQSSAGSVIAALEQALYEKSNETMEHTQRIKELSLKFGKKLKLHLHQLDELALLASLHDIGKVAVPETILLKEGALSESEWEVIKTHPATGFNIAQSSPQIAHIAKYILSCHENWDGSGYPEGLAKEEIPLLSRIVAIADSYDVMTYKRAYKNSMSKEDAVKELKRCAGTQFDPVLVGKFIEILAEK
ncbi:MAG: diguanylate cyclase, partial [Actinomycetota bacterium]